ncbi:Fer2/BFD BFD like 2Fe-2S--binding domain-containing protein [Brachyspira pilosicoli WesB]|uniref:Fer2/BFD BFD like 2Fe-2S--binding domain-containing protein n=1 Tax=Brachyspira pilosicoli WesB TaxID=1161918 RepID=K0JI58_BRAPL|nr:(2Fe-2S)-binding protein [Brachyspira pilosicoli]CCG56567.1 Fer2/BFD BFD like 2Fe-2S--binding domain-containing protein [Brachyspira pilosicoli WesB]
MADDKTICFCMGVKESQIIDAIKKNKLKTVEEVSNITKAGTGCGSCIPTIQKILDEINK